MSLLRVYFQFVPAARRKLALVILLNVAGALFQGASVGLLLPALQIAQNAGVQSSSGVIWTTIQRVYGTLGIPVTLLSLLLGVLALIMGGQALIYAQKRLSAHLSEFLVAGLRKHVFAAFLRADASFHSSVQTGNLTNTIAYDIARTGSAFEGLLELLARSILLAMFTGVLIAVSWENSLITFGVVAIAVLLVQYHIRLSRQLGKRMVETHQEFHSFTSERIDAARLVKLSNAEERDSARFGDIAENVASVRALHTSRGAQIRFLLEPSLAAGGIIAVYVGLTFLQMSLAQLAVFLYALMRIVPEAYSLNRSRFNIAGFSVHFGTVMDLVRQAEQRTTIAGGSREFTGLRRALTLENVSFSYDAGAPVLREINLSVEANRLTAILGPSGVGKSSLLDLIVRLSEPDSGRVLLDGVDIKEFDLASLRRGIAMVSQDILLFNDTVLENIRYGCPEASEEEVIEAATRANAHRFIQALPQGYHTLLGPRGMTISGGERQRIALARALLQKPSVLLLDEVTSNLDVESERLIQESVLQAAWECTVIAVTHRINTVQRADHIVVLDQGRIGEEGPPGTLLTRDGLFKVLFESQYEGEMASPKPREKRDLKT